MIETSLEKIWDKYGNKYRFLILASMESRDLIESIAEGKIDVVENPYRLGLLKALRGETESGGE
ncbi:hypothetical protein GF359_06945 [candidate division WOR-3 bacterium]|uniref:Uncharacterized protein n=1 Tax=candidate division WOR-3 bacterium TaxID=2052148 RepID=A0A9D5QED5_UNCW3|nr:hypothetical protein [candidate division WOR-3 bacterium]MBD3364935.1 hypothetical protein [candidate division WOR-3 bacterium]